MNHVKLFPLRDNTSRWQCALLCALLLVTGCRGAPPPTAIPQVAQPAIPGSVLYSVDAAASAVTLYVYREGAMAALGHNHVIAVNELAGSVQLHDELARTRFDLQFPVASMTVDPPALRAATGSDFSSVVGDAARTGTRNNMLGPKLLDAVGFAQITLRSERISTAPNGLLATTRIRVRDREALVDVPVSWQSDGNVLTVSGELKLRQTELGLTPYSVMLGALRVADQMTVRFNIVARRVAL